MDNGSIRQTFEDLPLARAEKNTKDAPPDHVLHAFPILVAAILTGLVSAAYSLLFKWADEGSQFMFSGNPWLFLFFTPLCFLLAWWLVHRISPAAGGSGIPQVLASLEMDGPREDERIFSLLGLKMAAVKVFSSLTCALGGGLVGREGPTIQIAAAIFHFVGHKFRRFTDKAVSYQALIVAGGAAGIASAFNTPLGGVVYAIEELA